MDKGSSSQIQKQSKRIKKTVNGLNLDLPLEAEGSVELSEQNSRSDIGEDSEVQEDSVEFPHQQKRRSRNKSGGGRLRGKGDIPKTFITAVLEELSEDVISEPTRLDAGNSSVIEAAPQAPASVSPDKVYVEHKSGFATTPRVKIFHPLNYGGEDIVDVHNASAVSTPLELAILVQKWCRPFYTLCHGLLGGMALLHIIMVYCPAESPSQESNFVHMYAHYARVYQTLFHILCIFCCISVLDRYDAKHMDVSHLEYMYKYHFIGIVILIVYFTTLVLTFVTMKWDDWLALSPYSVSVKNISDAMNTLTVWKNLNLFRNIGAISGWILTAFFPDEDMLYLYLCNMMKYESATTHPLPRY
jgi:hypothetical protein